MAFANGLDLTLTSKQRFIDQANYKHSWFLIMTKDQYGFTKNAELIDVVPVAGNKQHTARARFRIDRKANNVPFNFTEPKTQFINRGVYVSQLTADEIVKVFGVNGVVYLGLGENVPANNQGLAAAFKERFGLNMVAEDIVAKAIPVGAKCVTVTFAKMSVGFVGSLRVDLTTPVVQNTAPANV